MGSNETKDRCKLLHNSFVSSLSTTMLTKTLRITLLASWLCFLASAAGVSVAAFAPPAPMKIGKRSYKAAFVSNKTPRPPLLKMSKFDRDDDNEDHVEDSLRDGSFASSKDGNDQGIISSTPSSKGLQTVVRAIEIAWYSLGSIVWFCVGGFGTASLFMNLIGYDYTFSPEDGLNIDTIEHIREERLMEEQFKAYEKMQASIKPLSVLTDHRNIM